MGREEKIIWGLENVVISKIARSEDTMDKRLESDLLHFLCVILAIRGIHSYTNEDKIYNSQGIYIPFESNGRFVHAPSCFLFI